MGRNFLYPGRVAHRRSGDGLLRRVLLSFFCRGGVLPGFLCGGGGTQRHVLGSIYQTWSEAPLHFYGWICWRSEIDRTGSRLLCAECRHARLVYDVACKHWRELQPLPLHPSARDEWAWRMAGCGHHTLRYYIWMSSRFNKYFCHTQCV